MADTNADRAGLSFAYARPLLAVGTLVALALAGLAYLDHLRAKRSMAEWRAALCGTLPEAVARRLDGLRTAGAGRRHRSDLTPS